MIEAVIVEKQIGNSDEKGFDFDVLPRQTNGLKAGFTSASSNPAAAFLSILNAGDVISIIRLLETNDNIEILSKPKLLTLDRQTASVVVGQNVPFLTGRTITDNDTSKQFQQIERHNVGLSLRFTPYVVGNKIHIKINQSISSVSSSTQASDLITNNRSIDTMVTVTNGEMVSLGGLISTTTEDSVSGVPVLKDIPWLGAAFTNTSSNTKKTELTLMIKAQLI